MLGLEKLLAADQPIVRVILDEVLQPATAHAHFHSGLVHCEQALLALERLVGRAGHWLPSALVMVARTSTRSRMA